MIRRQTILYVSYDGMIEPLGQSQVIAYLERLAGDFRIVLMSYEKPADWADVARRGAIAARLRSAGIRWHPLRYHKSPTVPATALDIAQGSAIGLALAIRHGVAIIHARSFVAALIGRTIARVTGARLLYDMRGLWAQERVDGGLWADGGRLHRSAGILERRLAGAADHIVTLTEASRPIVAAMAAGAGGQAAPVTVIPTCADLERFAPAAAPSPPERFTLGYVGSIGTWYLFDEVLQFFKTLLAHRPDARLLVVNRGEATRVRAMAAAAGIADPLVEVIAVDHAGVPAMIRRMSAGAALCKPLPSKRASAPTKLAEYLGCGIPCIGNAGVGDMAAILEGGEIGVLLRSFTEPARHAAAERLLALCAASDTAARCRAAAVEHFSLDHGVGRYRTIYRDLLG